MPIAQTYKIRPKLRSDDLLRPYPINTPPYYSYDTKL
jgi:hypothetical protein